MRKYWFVFTLFWQEGLSQRATFFMERFRSLVVLVSFYYLWSALLSHRDSFAGYDRAQIITYVLGMNVLRGLVFASRTDQIPGEINHGRLSAYLLRPINFCAYTFVRDLSEKSINFVSAVLEVCGLALIFHMPLRWPHHATTWGLFALSTLGAMVLYFSLSFMVGCSGFWTAESGGPRFLVELILEFTAGAFFPIDILSPSIQRAFHALPSPYLVFFPLNLFLEKLSPQQIQIGFAGQMVWIILMGAFTRWVWSRGVQSYAAQGS